MPGAHCKQPTLLPISNGLSKRTSTENHRFCQPCSHHLILACSQISQRPLFAWRLSHPTIVVEILPPIMSTPELQLWMMVGFRIVGYLYISPHEPPNTLPILKPNSCWSYFQPTSLRYINDKSPYLSSMCKLGGGTWVAAIL